MRTKTKEKEKDSFLFDVCAVVYGCIYVHTRRQLFSFTWIFCPALVVFSPSSSSSLQLSQICHHNDRWMSQGLNYWWLLDMCLRCVCVCVESGRQRLVQWCNQRRASFFSLSLYRRRPSFLPTILNISRSNTHIRTVFFRLSLSFSCEWKCASSNHQRRRRRRERDTHTHSFVHSSSFRFYCSSYAATGHTE